MRKRIISPTVRSQPSGQEWLDLEKVAELEISSEDPAYPIESALLESGAQQPGWRASEPGEQVVRLRFDPPQRIRRIYLTFEEAEHERTQEFVLGWSADGGLSSHEILRQQFSFSPPSTTLEVEDYLVDLEGVTALELRIVPDISGGERLASLARLRLA